MPIERKDPASSIQDAREIVHVSPAGNAGIVRELCGLDACDVGGFCQARTVCDASRLLICPPSSVSPRE